MNKSLSETLVAYEGCRYLMLSNLHTKLKDESLHTTIFKVSNPINLQIEIINFVEKILGEFTFVDNGAYISFYSKNTKIGRPCRLELFDYTSGTIEVL
jgi:hypothetical protein